MKRLRNIATFVVFYFTTITVKATVIDLNLYYFTDGLVAAEESTYGATLYSAFIGFDLGREGHYQVGWNYSSHATETVENTTTVTYSSTQMGPGFVFYMGKKRNWRLGASYNLVTEGTYQRTGGTEEALRGSSMNADFGYQLRFESSLSIGFRINYVSTSFSESREATTVEDVSYSKSLIYPSAALTFEF